MITDLNTSILYICPECSTISAKNISAFGIKKDPVYLKCSNPSCKCNVCSISLAKEKYRFILDCALCGDEHTFFLSTKTLFYKNFFILNCHESGFGALFIGKDINKLKEEYNAQSETIAGIIANNDEGFDDLDILFEIIEKINELAKKNLIHCKCKSNEICVNINMDSVILSCKGCKKSLSFPATKQTLENLQNTEKILLD